MKAFVADRIQGGGLGVVAVSQVVDDGVEGKRQIAVHELVGDVVP